MNLRKQNGLSLIGFILILILALFFAYTGVKLVPIYLNHYSVVSSIKGTAEEARGANMNPSQIRGSLSRRLQVNYVENVRPADVEITRNPDTLRVDYEVREPFIANIDLVVSFSHSESLSN